ncbi:hypothetical protein [Flavobacterium algicola]|uniref:hypothetical protein n=1 Tax=Flavobacterium algicola TaxID=556529 RepID=UPI001EFE3FCD|nr:hypothetical protein [Flavobacterium algicola]MCG9791340.1 hypothetical protein [Flavobacterium algicola]
MRIKLTTISFLFFVASFAQTNINQEKIKSSIENYFQYDRENIHVQFSKDTYVANEFIGFKGYVYSKNYSKPHPYTTNVQLVIYDNQEQIVQKQLLYTKNGTFTGGFLLNDTFKPGRYHFHFYTNWMNNFKEDDSFTQEIEIISKTEPFYLKSNEPDFKTAKVTIYPEAEKIIDGLVNGVGISLTDCNQKGMENQEITVFDSKSNEITKFNTDKNGNGRFFFVPDRNESYTLKIKSEKITLSESLPKAVESGIIISYNNNLPKNILAVAIKTNEAGMEINKGKKFIIVLQQDVKSVQKEFSFKDGENEVVLYFDKQYLSNGVNSIRLIDENLNEICERLVYHYGSDEQKSALEAKSIANDSIQLTGTSSYKQGNISISVLPDETVSATVKNSIFGSFYLNSYLENPVKNNYSYFDIQNKSKKQEMEALMFNQNHSKFRWKNIVAPLTKNNYTFNTGVTIRGKIDKQSNNSENKITLISLKDNLYEVTNVDANNNFKFENFYAQDSTTYIVQMNNAKNITKFTNMDTSVLNFEKKFALPLHLNLDLCPVEKKPENLFTFTAPMFDDTTINLESVAINNNFKKEQLTHLGDMSAMADGYKMGESDFGSLLDFLTMHGYRSGLNPEDNTVYITSNRGTINNSTPSIFIDNIFQYDLNILFGMTLSQIDEIYIDKTSMSDTGLASGSGTIKIFLKAGGAGNNFFKTKHNTMIVTNGFTKSIDFVSTTFETQKEYFYFGTLNWTPTIIINDNSNFKIKFPKTSQSKINVLIEGFTPEGALISEFQKIPVQ